MLILCHQVTQLLRTPMGSSAVWARQPGSVGVNSTRMRQDRSFHFFFPWKKPPPLQGVARADLRKKLCSIGNEL